MKKSTKYLLIIAVFAIVVGAVGVGIGIGQVNEDRLNVDLALKKDIEELTLRIDNTSEIDLHINQSETDHMTISDRFMPTNASYEFNEKGKTAELIFKFEKNNSLPEGVQLGISSGNELEVTIPDSVKKLHIQSDSNQQTYLNISQLALDKLSMGVTKTESHLYDTAIQELEVTADSGSFHLNDSNVTGKSTIKGKSAHIVLERSTLAEDAQITSQSGDIQLWNVTAKDLSLENNKGDTTLEEIKGPVKVTSETGDIYYAASKLTHDVELTSKNGKVISVLRDKAKSQTKIQVKNSPDVLLFNEEKMTVDNEKAEHTMTLQSDLGIVRVYELLPIGYDEETGEIVLDKDADDETIDHYRIDGEDETAMENSRIDFHNEYWPNYQIFEIYYHY
ncbi:DUF4097 family beta strand repeat-containing protein [Vagococcus elongatus]|uniref:DUF4097 domain-containing protein n=1 Tax=Vagococcus elongatus TaxID=180344 RepID=A0A430AYD0_9ENTE|nr:DUF4097 family beta strand repeat-containing protein [Vagococcus elongatus]RSU13081.1 hypothetical protein CBF29_05275 [Vagococcus elongatus]